MSHILIADPHTLCREALCSYIRHIDQGLSVEGFSDTEQLFMRMKDGMVDLVIVDQDLQGWENLYGVKTAMLVRAVNEEAMMNPNLQGVFSRNIPSKIFLKGIQDILAGGTFFCSEVLAVGAMTELPKIQPQNFNLTAREKEVLSYLVKGQSNKDIARALDLQVVTVKLHVRGICRKMKAANRTQAALTAKETGWS